LNREVGFEIHVPFPPGLPMSAPTPRVPDRAESNSIHAQDRNERDQVIRRRRAAQERDQTQKDETHDGHGGPTCE
jgi:hypothetical protein